MVWVACLGCVWVGVGGVGGVDGVGGVSGVFGCFGACGWYRCVDVPLVGTCVVLFLQTYLKYSFVGDGSQCASHCIGPYHTLRTSPMKRMRDPMTAVACVSPRPFPR